MKKDSLRQAIADQMLEAALKEAPASADSILFFARSLGLSVEDGVSYDEAGLIKVEGIYRRLYDEEKFSASLDRAHFEQLMMYFLGQTLVSCQDAHWIAYKGRDHVVRPLLIRFADTGKGLDIAAICFDLIGSSGLAGANVGQALVRYFNRAKKIALILT